jgi:hypothetical protein
MDANELKDQPRLPLQRAVDWILSDQGSKIWTNVFVEKDNGDGQTFQNYSWEYSAAALRAVNELLGKIHGGQLKARGYPDGDETRGREEIPVDKFPDTATDSPYGETSLESLLPKEGYGEKKKSHLLFEDSAQIRYFRTVYWSGIVVSGDDVLALWPPASGLDRALIEAANQNGGTISQKSAEEIARNIRASASRDEIRGRLKHLGIAGKQGRKKVAR